MINQMEIIDIDNLQVRSDVMNAVWKLTDRSHAISPHPARFHYEFTLADDSTVTCFYQAHPGDEARFIWDALRRVGLNESPGVSSVPVSVYVDLVTGLPTHFLDIDGDPIVKLERSRLPR